MVIDFRIRKSLNIQYDELQFKNMVTYVLKDSDIILCVFKGKRFYASIEYHELRLLSSNEELYNYIDKKSIHEWVHGFEIDRLSKLFSDYKDATTIIVEIPDINKNELLTVNRADVGYDSDYVDFSIYMKLKQEGVMAYIVNLPRKVQSVYGPFYSTGLKEQWLRNPVIRKEFEHDLKRITELSDHEYIAKVLDRCMYANQKRQLESKEKGKANRNIFLVEPLRPNMK